MQAALHLIYPPQCINCEGQVATDFGLCGPCWRETPFITGLVCDKCGAPLTGNSDRVEYCDDCLTIARPWERGRAALIYRGTARTLTLALKHGDRMDLARPAAQWLVRAALPLLEPDMVVAPIPLHWLRLIKRRYNQAALLAAGLAQLRRLDHCPDLLQRHHATPAQSGGRDARFANMAGAIRVHPRRAVQGRNVLVVDDVMTSGATFAAAAEALLAAGAAKVTVLALARVVKDG